MPQTFDPLEKWEVNTGKDKFSLNGKQAQLIKNAAISGQRGLIFFDGFAISLAHIVSMTRLVSTKDLEKRNKTIAKMDKIKTTFNK